MPSVRLPLFSACAAFMLAGCNAKTDLRQANVDQVNIGMAKKQVESILGLPDEWQAEPQDLASKKVTYTYNQHGEKVVIVFWDDKVESISGRFSR
jgi:outer membrane biogenesis lipoprotein LolB